jgi:hypothetical protein
MKRILSVGTLFVLLSSSLLLAHDPKLHKGRPVEGTVQSLTSKGLELKTDKGVKTVVFTDKTEFEHGNQKLTRSDIKANEHLLIFGTTLASGEIVAKEVHLAPAEHESASATHKH